MTPQAGLMLLNEVTPRLRSAIPNNVCFVGSEDAQEVVQDSIAMAAKMLHNAHKNRKKVTPGNVAYYCILHAKSGRRSVGYSSVDVLATATQLNGKSRVESFDEPVAIDEETQEFITLGEVCTSKSEDPAMEAARNLDWQEFVQSQDDRGRAILRFMAEGRKLKEVARKFKVCDSTIQQHRNRLAAALLEFMGADVVHQATRKPQWNDNLHATSEKLACKDERRHM